MLKCPVQGITLLRRAFLLEFTHTTFDNLCKGGAFMAEIHSTFTELPRSCKSAADHIAQELAKEDIFASLSDANCEKLTKLEQTLSKETGENVILVAYRT